MDNYKQPGSRVRTTNLTGVAVSAGGVLTAGRMVRVAIVDIAAAATEECAVAGVFELAATVADAWADGALLYWDAATGMLTDTVAANLQAGFAAGAKIALETTAEVLLQSV